jgi:hypothetical protein
MAVYHPEVMEQIIEFAGNHTMLVGAFVIVLAMLIGNEIGRLTRGFKDISPTDAFAQWQKTAKGILSIVNIYQPMN